MLADGSQAQAVPNRRAVADAMLPLVYDELRLLAASYLRRERPNHTLQATAVVHEAYLRLVAQTGMEWTDRAHFTALMAHMMRQLLVDHIRERGAVKRGGGLERVALDEAAVSTQGRPCGLLALDDALSSLARLDAQKATIIELHFFGGLTLEEVAEVLGVSRTTVKRQWRRARAWLYRELGGGDDDGSATVSTS